VSNSTSYGLSNRNAEPEAVTFVGVHLGAWWRLDSVEEFVDSVHPAKPLLLKTRYLLPHLIPACIAAFSDSEEW